MRQARTGVPWRVRLGVVAAGLLVLPVLASLAVPGPPEPTADGGPDDLTRLALAASGTLTGHAQRYRGLQVELGSWQEALDRAREEEAAARTAAETARGAVGTRAADLYRSSPTGRLPVYDLDVRTPDRVGGVFLAQTLADRADRSLESAVVQADRAGSALAAASRRVGDVEQRLASVADEAEAVLAAARAETATIDPSVAGRIAGPAAAPQGRDQQALNRWRGYLDTLATAGITPPPAAELADPAALPPGYAPARTEDGEPVAGVARALAGTDLVTVLPAETVSAVSAALAQLGKPYAPGTQGPDTYGCAGLTASSWLLAGYAVPATAAGQWTAGRPVPPSELQVGDLVVSPGGADVGIYLGDSDVLGASAASFRVAVRSLPAGASAVRVTLPPPAEPNAPLAPRADVLDCGATPSRTPGSPAWGGFSNGRIPAASLCRLGVHSHALRCDAAASYAAMSEAFAVEFGEPLCVTDSYRSFEAQVSAYARKPALAAPPGTSNHGWALAVDLCGGINRGGSAPWRWMTENAGRFGWVQPDWAGPRGEKPEPWHWEFGYIS